MRNYIERLTVIKPEELKAVLLGFTGFFFLLGGCYVLRPIRDAMGLTSGIQNLHWLFTITFLVILLASSVFSWLYGHFQRQRLIVGCYSFLLINLLCFYFAYSFLPQNTQVITGRIFFIWQSVYNLFAASLFWSFMADGFDLQRSRRVFAFISAGGSTGALCGSAISQFFVETAGVANLFLVSGAELTITICIVIIINREFARKYLKSAHTEQKKAGKPSFSEGIRTIFESPFLRAIAFYIFCYTLSSTFIYFLKANMVNDAGDSTKAFVVLFSRIDLWRNALTVVLQFFLTAKLVKKLGITIALLALPLTTFIGFLALSVSPIMTVIVVFESLRRSIHYALSKPSLDALYSPLNQNEIYPAKNFIDTFVYRGGDAAGAWLCNGIRALVMGVAVMAWIALPLAVAWCWTAAYLGRNSRENKMEKVPGEPTLNSSSPQTDK